MRRAARIVFHLAAGVSAILFFAGMGSWVASYRAEQKLTQSDRETYWAAYVSRGDLGVVRFSLDMTGRPHPWSPPEWRWERGAPRDLWTTIGQLSPPRRVAFAGVFYARGRTLNGPSLLLLIPIPFLVVPFAALPLADLFVVRPRHRRRRRAAAGLCVRCGYDLRATPEKCPECGAIPIAPPV